MPRQTDLIALKSPSPGTTRHLRVHRYGTPKETGGAGPKAYLHSSLHADEWPGLLVLHHLTKMLDMADAEGRISGEIVLLPYANPIGLSQRLNGYLAGRFYLDGGGNFNRDWPDLTDAAASTLDGKLGENNPENIRLIRSALSAAAAELPRDNEMDELRATLLGLSIDADIVLDLHCDSLATLHVYANRAQQVDAMTLTRELGSPVLLLEEEPGGGPFDEANHGPWIKLRERFDLGNIIAEQCFSATVELRGSNDVTDDLAEQDAAALMRFLMRKGVVKGDPGDLKQALCTATPLDGVDVAKAPASGVVAWHKTPGDQITAGEHIADLIDIEADDPAKARTAVIARTSGLMFARHAAVLVKAGDQICKIAGAKPLEHRQGGALLSP